MRFSTNSMCELLEGWAKRAGLNNIRVLIAEDEKGVREYVAYEGDKPIYANSSTEAMACHFDILGLASRKPSLSGEKGKKK